MHRSAGHRFQCEMRRWAGCIPIVPLLVAISSCDHSSPGPTSPPTPRVDSIRTVPAVQVVIQFQTVQFRCKVWVTGGADTTCIWSANAPNGVLTADTVGVDTVRATAKADSSKVAESLVEVDTAIHWVRVIPDVDTAEVDSAVRYSAYVSGGSGADTRVRWSVVEPANCGTIDQTGLWTAPASPAICHVRATSVLDTTKSDPAIAIALRTGGLAYDNGRDIFLARVDSQGTLISTKQLTHDASRDGIRPSWSPDGKQLVYEDHDIYNFDVVGIAVMNSDGSNAHLIVPSDSCFKRSPRWSPDGTRIAFQGCDGLGNTNIFLVNPDGSGRLQVTYETCGSPCPAFPSWTPNGRILFMSYRDGNWEIYETSADGLESGTTNLSQSPTTDDYWPAMSPDGGTIAYASTPKDSNQFQIVLMNADGSGQRAIKSGGYSMWTSDGKRIFYEGGLGIRVMNPDGSNDTASVNYGLDPAPRPAH